MKVTFPQMGIELDAVPGQSLPELLNEAGLEMPMECGGRGGCGKCRVKFQKGAPRPRRTDRHHIDDADIKAGVRLACAAVLNEDCEIEFLTVVLDSRATGFQQGYTKAFSDNAVPALKKITIDLPHPSVTDQRSDLRRLTDFFKLEYEIRLPISVLRSLPSVLRNENFSTNGIIERHALIGFAKRDGGPLLAAAIDIGTTTICGRLINIESGMELSSAVASNPQRLYGADVASRINFTMNTTRGLNRLRELVVGRVNDVIAFMTTEAGVGPERIFNVTAVGNPSMVHIFLGIEPRAIAPAPYISPTTSLLEFDAAEASLEVAPGAVLRVLPAAAAYIGADAVSAAIRGGLLHSKKPAMVIDLGTNAEIILTDGAQFYACSAAAGPALEGAHTKCGMTAARGAISVVNINENIDYETIGKSDPIGICGTGLLDSICGMIATGVVDASGRMSAADSEGGPGKIVESGEGREFVIAETNAARIFISQKDVRQYQLARGAIRGGVQVLLEKAGLTASDLDKIYLAGALGTAIRTESALGAGIVPSVNQGVIESIGNAALDGAADAILDESIVKKAEQFAEAVEYVELSAEKTFTDLFVKHMNFDS